MACPFILLSQPSLVGLWTYLPPSHLSRDSLPEVIRECGYFLGVGRVVGLGLFMQVLEGRFLSSLEHRVAAGTNQPLVWGMVGDDLSHRPYKWDVLLLCKHVGNQLCVGVFPVPYQEHSPPPFQLCMPPAALPFILQPPGSWIPVVSPLMHSEMRGSVRYRDWYQNSLLLGNQSGYRLLYVTAELDNGAKKVG